MRGKGGVNKNRRRRCTHDEVSQGDVKIATDPFDRGRTEDRTTNNHTTDSFRPTVERDGRGGREGREEGRERE
jgi:hypothetical protein